MDTQRKLISWAAVFVLMLTGVSQGTPTGTATTGTATTAPMVDLSQFPPDAVWRCANSTISSLKDPDGTVMWRWEIKSGGEAFLWLNESLPVHKDLSRFQRLMFDVNFAEGRIDQFWPRTVGLLAPPDDKMFCEWNLFYFTHPHKTWITYQQVLSDPTWFAFPSAFSQPPQDVKMDRAHALGFECLAKGQSCVVELRHCRLIRDTISVIKPYLTNPIGWPELERKDSGAGYRTPYFVKNVSAHPVAVSTAVRSPHALFDITVDPAQATIPPGQRRRFDVIASLSAEKEKTAAPMAEETAVVEFVPDRDESLAYRTETLCTAPLPEQAQRMAMYTPQQVRDLKRDAASAVADAKFWMNVKLDDQTEIPHGVGHMLIWAIPAKCPVCKTGTLHADENWLEVECDRCGHTEMHSRLADAVWIATWAAIHGSGSSPLSLGRAYLATGDEKYAKKAIQLLKILAGGYAKLPWHNANSPAGWDHAEPASPDAVTIGASARWGNSPSYGTNFMVAGLAALHNTVVNSPSWTDHDRALVHDGFWVPVATELMKITPGISNMNDINNHDLILAALSTGDANILYRGTLDPMGIASRMKDISPDGFSDEGSALNYHWGAAREWFPSIEVLLNSKIPFPGLADRAAAAIKMPLLRASLSGIAYCTGNSGAAWFSVPLDADMFVMADRVFSPEIWPRQRHYATEPTLFRNAGWAILRTGQTPQTQVMVNVDYGRSHGHGDLDRMNLGLLAFGQPLSADPGSTYNYNVNAAEGAAAASMSGPFVANTVIVDGQPQLRGAGELIAWDPTPSLQRLTAQINGIYPGVGWRRSVVLIDHITIVVDDLQSDQAHRYESAWHHYGAATVGEGCQLSNLDQPLGEGAYKDLLNPRRISGQPIVMDWKVKDVHVRAWQPAEEGQLAYTAQTGVCWDNVRGLPVDGLFARRQGKSTRFVTVLEPYQSQPVLKGIIISHAGARTTVKLNFINGTSREVSVDAGYREAPQQ
jgi:hypothetical protein